MTTPPPIPGAFQEPATDKTPFGKTGPHRPVAECRKEFVKVLLSMSRSTAASDVFRRWAGWLAYTVAADTAGMPCEPENEQQAANLAEWRKALCARRDSYERQLEGVCDDWRDRACRLMEIMAEGLEAAQGDFLSTVLESDLEGTNKWNGQFFTPLAVGLMMGRVVAPNPRPGWVESINDPCCGCGRLPIAGAAVYLERGGRKDDLLLDVADIDEGSVCACFVQCWALGLACRAQAMDTLRMEPHGPMMVNPFYVMYGIPTRMKMQRAVEAMDAQLKAAQKRAGIAQGAPEAAGRSGGAQGAGDATGSDLEGTEGLFAGEEQAEHSPTPPEAAASFKVAPRAEPLQGKAPRMERGTGGKGALGAEEHLEKPAAPVQGVLPGFE